MAILTKKPEISVEEYLRFSARPDVELVDGRLEERNLGTFDHARIQALLLVWFFNRETEFQIVVVPEQRVQVSPNRFRVPDICLLPRERPVEQIIHTAPLVCIEVLSPDDTISSMRVRVADYLAMGVENVWIVDPASREALICTPTEWRKAEGRLAVDGGPIFVELSEIFSGLGYSH